MQRTWLKILRINAGYNQKELAKKIGVTNQTLSNVENGRRMPSGEVAYKLSIILGFEMTKFYEEVTA